MVLGQSLPPLPALRVGQAANAAAIACITALLAIGLYLTSAHIRALRASDMMVDQVRRVDLAAERVLATLRDAETGQRGYLLTGDVSYLQPYSDARLRVEADFARLAAAPLISADYAARLAQLHALARDKLAIISRTIALHDHGQPDAALRLVRTNAGEHMMDAIRHETAQLEDSTEAQLIRARAQIHTGSVWLDLGAPGALAAVCLSALLWFRRRTSRDARAQFRQLQRFTSAFGQTQGTLLDMQGRVLFWGAGAERLYGFSPEQAKGRVCRELLSTKFPVPQADIAAALERDGAWHGEVECRHRDGHAVQVISQWALSRGEGGEPDVAIEVSNDITSMRRADQERQRADALLRTILQAAPGLIYAKDRQGRMILANGPVLDLIGKPWGDVEGRTDAEFLPDRAQGDLVMANDRQIMDAAVTEEFEEIVGMEFGRQRVWSSIKAPLLDAQGIVVGLVGVSVDITERKRIEDRLRLMVDELNHRVKNTLATVQAIATQTLRGGDPSIRQTLEMRLLALAAAHDVLTRERWEGAGLNDLVHGALAPFGGAAGGRFTISGPAFRVAPRASLALAMGLHELATNAIKYGALSTVAGHVAITWEMPKGTTQMWQLSWRESGGPAVAPPKQLGFGIKLIERSLAQDLGGRAAVSFDNPNGVVGTVEAPLHEVAASAEVLELPRVGGAFGRAP